MAYKVLTDFTNGNEGRVFRKGDAFPFDSEEEKKERIELLLSDKNGLKRPVIELIKEETKKAKKK